MMNRCPMCGYDEIEDVLEPISKTLDDVTYTRTVPAEKCPGCGERLWRADVLRAFDIYVERQLVKLDKVGIEGARFLEKCVKAQKFYDESGIPTDTRAREDYREIWDGD